MKILNLIKNLIRFKTPYKLEIVKVMPQREEIVPMQVEHTINIPTDERFEKLAEQVASLVKHYDAMADKLTDEAMKALLADMSNHLINTLVLGGCDPIADDVEFDMLRHIPTPFTLVEQGTSIQSIVRIGVKLNGKVLTPAKVRI